MSLSDDEKVTAADPRLKEGVDLFNRADFFEAHEAWESLWHETHGGARDFVRGLIQVTSAMHHLQVGNLRGARILHDSGEELLGPYGTVFAGFDLTALKLNFNHALREVVAAPLGDLPGRGYTGTVRAAYGPERAFKIEWRGVSS
jgi:predicted metal-dependent hydrolase